MESFAEKVRYGGGGIRFDPMLEEKGSWILGEALKHDVEMVDAVIEVMVEASQRTFEEGLNLWAQKGEISPSNFERNVSDPQSTHVISF